MAERSNTQYYDPSQAREKTRAMSKRYRELQQDVNGSFRAIPLIVENRPEYLKPGNDGIKDTVEEANVLFDESMSFWK
jgi:hypothetical protein